MIVEDTIIVALKTVILLLGSGVTYIAYRAFRRTEADSLQVLAIGFGTITLGALLAGVANQLLGVTVKQGIIINSALVAVGLAVILYSLYLEQ